MKKLIIFSLLFAVCFHIQAQQLKTYSNRTLISDSVLTVFNDGQVKISNDRLVLDTAGTVSIVGNALKVFPSSKVTVLNSALVANTGKVAIGTTSEPISPLSVGYAGYSDANTAFSSSNKQYGVYLKNTIITDTAVGIYSEAGRFASSLGGGIGLPIGITETTPYAVGVYGVSKSVYGSGLKGVAVKDSAPNPAPWGSWMKGVSGLISNTSGAGVYGSDSLDEVYISGQYAGYFNGYSIVNNGTLTAEVMPSSDERLKENIRNLDSKETIEKILQLRPVEYNLKQIYSQYDSLTESGEYVQVTAKRYDETRPFFKQKRYGLLAQEVQKIYPDLVYEAPDGYLGINYTGLVPILLQVIQEQQATLEAIQQQLADKKRMQNSASGADLSSNQFRKAELLQNAPNPFRENTRIDFYLPENVKEAFLFIYNMNGEQIKKFPLSQRQSANLTLKGQELKAGMYLYTLIADGSVVDTKQMILTK